MSQQQNGGTSKVPDAERGKLLVINDDQEILKVLSRQFQDDYDIFIANSAEEGYPIMTEMPIQVIISDQRLPGMTGVAFFERMKTEFPDAIRLLLTGYADIRAVIDAINAGVIYRYIVNPWDPVELDTIVHQAFERNQIIAQNRRLQVELREATSALHSTQLTTATQQDRNASLLTRLLDTVACAILVYNFESNQTTFANAYIEEMTGQKVDNTGEFTMLDLYHPDEQPAIIHYGNHVLTRLADGEVSTYEARLRHRDGHWVWVKVRDVVLSRDAEGRVREILGVIVDISEQKALEAELREANKGLRASEQRYHTVVEDQAELICRFLADGRLAFANGAYSRFVGKPEEELIGQTVPSFILPLDPQGSGRNFLTLSPAKPLVTYERQLPSADNDLLWLHWTCRAFFDLDGQITEYQAVGRDITERKIAETQALELALEHQKVVQLSNFVRAVSHDLYTPLSILSTGLYLLPRTGDPDAKTDRIRNMEHQIERMKALIGEGIILADLDAGPAMALEPVDISGLLSSLAASLTRRAMSSGLRIVLDLEAAPPSVEADEARLHEALIRVVDNALQFTPRGGVITLRTRIGSEAVMEIIDTGVGISGDELEHIFDRFYRVDKARSEETGGAGLGLAIAKRIIELHGGRIDVSSVVGEGSTFRIVLPIQQSTGKA